MRLAATACVICPAAAKADATGPRPIFGDPYNWAGGYLGANAGGAIPLQRSETFQGISGFIGPAYDLHPPGREGSGLDIPTNMRLAAKRAEG